MTPAEALAEAEQIDRRLAAECAGFRRGWRGGYEAACAEMAADWAAVATPVARGGPSHAELELRRWGTAGRARFGDPRPGDRYPAREGAA